MARFEIENLVPFDRAVLRAARGASQLRFAMGEIARDISKQTSANFNLRGSGRYTPLSPRYARRKRRLARGFVPILTGVRSGGGRSGRLKAAAVGSGTGDSIREITDTSITYGVKNSRVPYARYVQEGTRRMPARPYLFVDKPAQERRFTAIVRENVINNINKAL